MGIIHLFMPYYLRYGSPVHSSAKPEAVLSKMFSRELGVSTCKKYHNHGIFLGFVKHFNGSKILFDHNVCKTIKNVHYQALQNLKIRPIHIIKKIKIKNKC